MDPRVSGAAGGAGSGALAGGAIGTAIFPGVGTALGAAGGAVVGGLAGLFGGMGAKDQSDAATQIALQQMEEQRRTQGMAMGANDQEIASSGPSMEELMGMQSQLDNLHRTYYLQGAALNRDLSIAKAFNPSMFEAGGQLYNLMHGGDASTLDPIRNERKLGRQQLEDQLRQQFGSGYASSSAGIEALTRYDQETASTMSQAQSQQLSQYMGFVSQNNPNLMGDANSAGSTLGQLAGQYSNTASGIQSREMQAYRDRIGAIEGTSLTPYAGAGSAGQLMQGQYNANMGSQIMGGSFGLAGSIFQGAGKTMGNSMSAPATPAPVSSPTANAGTMMAYTGGGYNPYTSASSFRG